MRVSLQDLHWQQHHLPVVLLLGIDLEFDHLWLELCVGLSRRPVPVGGSLPALLCHLQDLHRDRLKVHFLQLPPVPEQQRLRDHLPRPDLPPKHDSGLRVLLHHLPELFLGQRLPLLPDRPLPILDQLHGYLSRHLLPSQQ